MKVSVIIPAFNEEKMIAQTLALTQQSMTAFTDRGWETELIVCDNNSTDRTAELAKAAGATVVFEPFNQIGKARNSGARAATGDWFVFQDADAFPTKELYAEVAETMADEKCIGGSALIGFDEDSRDARFAAGYWNFHAKPLRWFIGMFHFAKADDFRQVGGNDERYFGSEDLRLGYALKVRGWRTGKTTRILKRNRIRTSARKIHLYNKKEIAKIFFKMLFTFGRSFRKRENCAVWYDGRR